MATYDYLREKIRNGVWLGKEFLQIYDFVQDCLNAPVEFFMNLPPIRLLREHTPEGLILGAIESVTNLSSIVTNSALLLLETIYGVNKSYNSEIHAGRLIAQGNNVLAQTQTTDTEIRSYKSAYLAHDDLLPEISAIAPYTGQLISFFDEGNRRTAQSAQAAINKLQTKKQELEAQVESLTGEARTKVKRIINRLTKLLGLSSVRSLNSSRNVTSSISTPAPRLLPFASPTVTGTHQIFSTMSGVLVKDFMVAQAVVSGEIAGALVQTSTSVGLKMLECSGANASRYLAAGFLRAAPTSIVYGSTGTGATAWTFLMSHWALLLVAAVLIVVLVTTSTDVVADHLYIFARRLNAQDMSFARMKKSTGIEVKQELTNLYKDLLNESGKNYAQVYGFALDRNVPTYGMNLLEKKAFSKGNTQETFKEFEKYTDEEYFWTH